MNAKAGVQMTDYKIIDTYPKNRILSGGVLCNLKGSSNGIMPDFIYGQVAIDKSSKRKSLNWLHWDGHQWRKTIISNAYPVQVGMAVADITGNRKLDVIFAEWNNNFWWTKRKARPGGNIYWAEQTADPFQGNWPVHQIAKGFDNAHDILVGGISGRSKPDIVVRNKYGKISWLSKPKNPRKMWKETIIIEKQDGDGTALFDITGTGSMDIITATGFYRKVDRKGKNWEFHSFGIDKLELHPETRVMVGDLLNDGSISVVITESEVSAAARIIILHSADKGKNWTKKVLINKERDFRGLHTLQLFDINGDGLIDIFLAEMENERTDSVKRKPVWKVFLNKGNLEFSEFTLLDVNLGAHLGCVGPIRLKEKPEFIAKDWLPNKKNACGGKNHIVHIKNYKLSTKI